MTMVPTRPYTSALRAEQAANTRRRILDASAQCFATSGFAGTSLRDVAETAGVSVETVKLNGPKSALMINAFEQLFTGSEGHESLEERDAVRAIMALENNDEFTAHMIGYVTEGLRRTSQLWSAFVSAASSDARVKEVLDDFLLRRDNDVRNAITECDRRGMITTKAPRAELAASLSFLTSPEGYAQLVAHAGWSHERYTQWVADAVQRLVLGV